MGNKLIRKIFEDDLVYDYNFFCPKCLTFAHASPTIRRPEFRGVYGGRFGSDEDMDIENDMELIACNYKLIMQCPVCKQEMEDIDPEMLVPILKLNNLGYRTIYSCQGHVRYKNTFAERMERPYIVFANLDEDGSLIVKSISKQMAYFKHLTNRVDELISNPKYKLHIEDHFSMTDGNMIENYYIETNYNFLKDTNFDGNFTDEQIKKFEEERVLFMDFVKDLVAILEKDAEEKKRKEEEGRAKNVES